MSFAYITYEIIDNTFWMEVAVAIIYLLNKRKTDCKKYIDLIHVFITGSVIIL